MVDFILELVQNLYCGDSPYGPDTREYKICCGLLNVIDAFLNTVHFSIGKVLKGCHLCARSGRAAAVESGSLRRQRHAAPVSFVR